MGNAVKIDWTLCTQEYDDGRVFHGQCRNGKFNGNGKMTWKNGDYYEGTWVDGEQHGDGVYMHGDGARYQGQFKHNFREGYGVFNFADGSLYEGMWHNSKPEGQGRMVYPSGEIIAGHFKDGQRDMSKLFAGKKRQDTAPVPVSTVDKVAGMMMVPKLPPLGTLQPGTAPASQGPAMPAALPRLPVLPPIARAEDPSSVPPPPTL
eukprot:gnl/TRDRNA2_/TRDRNA2_187801_c0_seq1.p1 gnl/TRDRNA2_/TRDRNA2_187801_c0~~gnl/TRDRNA2_/TRDRNA2_187801_c0_seq1.p1  ORF type:complete len:205 (-),score=41.96 gnl/TRDRNA2_/TRDRNA2_187801_c0_seq1:104-718(-)